MVRVRRGSSAILLIDVQERLMPVMAGREELEKRLQVLLEGCTVLDIPLIWTEQYVKGLGVTIPSIAERATLRGKPIEKLSFSCCPVPGVDAALRSIAPKTVVVAGIETHVCVLQTCLDLLDGGYQPVLVADCTTSRHAQDRELAITRLERAGVVLTTVESVLFELLEEAGTDEFKAISLLVKPL